MITQDQPLPKVLSAELPAHAPAAGETLSHILALLPVGVYTCDASGRITFFNQKAAELWGRVPPLNDDEEKFCACARVLMPDGSTLPPDRTPMAIAIREGRPFRNVEAEVERPDGTRFTASVNIDPLLDAEGKVTGAINVFHDITEAKAAKTALERELLDRERSEEHARFLSRLSQRLAVVDDPDVIVRIACEEVAAHLDTDRCFFTESDGGHQSVSIGEDWARDGLPKLKGVYRSGDFAAAEWLAAPSAMPLLVADVVSHPFTKDFAAKFEELHIRAFALAPFVRGEGGVSNLMVTSGRPRAWREDEQGLLENVVARVRPLVEQARDQKRSEAELRASERRWRELAEAMPHLVWVSAPDGTCEFISPQWCAYTGQKDKEQSGMGWAQAIHPEDRKPFEAAWNQAAHARSVLDLELRIRRSDGAYRWFKTRVVPVMDSARNILKWYGSNTDIEDIRRTDQALRENESRLSALFTQAGAGIIQTDLEGRIVMVNEAYCEIVARKREEVMGMHIHDLTHPQDRQLHREPFDDMMRGGPAFIIEKRDVRPDGTAVWVRNSVVGIRDSAGIVTAGLTIAQDITDSREAEDAMRASEEQLRLVTDHAPVLLAQFDRQHRYKFVNQPYAVHYGCEPVEIIGKHAREVLGAEGYASLQEKMEQAFQGQKVEFEMEMPKAGHPGHWWNVIFVAERNASREVVGLVSVLTDITRRKEEERELEQARDHALAAVRAKDDFLARLSHELRTPLSPVLLLASEGAANAELPAAARADFETIRKNVDLEARLIDDLLDLTRITRGKLALDQTLLDVHAVLTDAVAHVRPDAQGKNISVELRLEAAAARVTGDAVRLQQVFWNVLNNAVKFTQPGGNICIQTRLVSPEGPIRIEISDNGIGMTAEELQRAFNAFSQGDHAGGGGSARYGGLGLGLAISRMLVELQRGQIRADSKGRGLGATFTVELPLRVGEAAEHFSPSDGQPTGPLAPRRTVSEELAPLRILLVEDHEPTRTALTSLLGRRKHAVHATGSLAEARQALLAETFDLLVSDIGLPDGTGYELMAEVRVRRLRGIALSGYGMEQDVARSREAGFSAHLTKPVRMQALDTAIAETCNLHSPEP